MRSVLHSLKVCPPPDILFKPSPVCKYVFSATGNQEAIWLQILKANYNDKIPFGGFIELSGYIRKGDTKFWASVGLTARTYHLCVVSFPGMVN